MPCAPAVKKKASSAKFLTDNCNACPARSTGTDCVAGGSVRSSAGTYRFQADPQGGGLSDRSAGQHSTGQPPHPSCQGRTPRGLRLRLGAPRLHVLSRFNPPPDQACRGVLCGDARSGPALQPDTGGATQELRSGLADIARNSRNGERRNSTGTPSRSGHSMISGATSSTKAIGSVTAPVDSCTDGASWSRRRTAKSPTFPRHALWCRNGKRRSRARSHGSSIGRSSTGGAAVRARTG